MIGKVCLRPVGTRGGRGEGWWPCACPGGLTSGLGCVRPTGLLPTRTSTRPLRPLSLQDAGRTFPHSVGKVHQEAGDASVPIITSFDRQKLSGRGGRLRPSHSRIWSSKFISYQEDWFGLAISCWHRQEQNAASLHPTNPRQDLSPGESLAAAGCAEYSRE